MEQITLPYVSSSSTSQAAAVRETAKAVSDNKRILELFVRAGATGLTDREIESAIGLRQSTASARRRGLVLSGKVKDSGGFRMTPSGNKATVWILQELDRSSSVPAHQRQPKTKAKWGTEVDNTNLRTLFFCSIRYSLGRQTYMPGLIQDIVKGHKDVLSADDCRQLANEITTEYAWRNGNLGADFDTKGWIDFKDWLLQEAECR